MWSQAVTTCGHTRVHTQAARATYTLQLLVPGRKHWKDLAEIALVAVMSHEEGIKLLPSVGGGIWGYNEFDYTAA